MPSVPLNMPKMSMTMEEGTIVEWLRSEGDAVAHGDVVAIVTTDKVDMEVESTANGTISAILHEPGAIVAVGEPIATIESEDEDLLGDLLTPPPPSAGDEPVAPATPAGASGPAPVRGTRVIAAPLARKLAREAGLDLATIAPTSPSGIVRARDVREAIARSAPAGAPARATISPPPRATIPAPTGAGELVGDARSRRLRVTTATVMSASAGIPQFTLQRRLDLGATARARRASLQGISWTTLLVRGYAMMLRTFPLLGGTFTEAGVRANAHVGIALAVDTPSGLLAPVLADPDQTPIRELDAAVRRLADQARSGALTPDSMTGATGTLSNLGGLGVDRFNALLTPPQATALSVGTVGHRVRVEQDGTFAAVLTCDVGLTVDHRAADGADGARGLDYLQEVLSDPLTLAV